MLLPATRGAAPRDIPVLDSLRSADIGAIGRVVHSSNAVFFLELDAEDPTSPGGRLRAIYKPMRGERPLWDFPRGTLHLREAASYLVDAALGFGHVPATTLRDGPLGPGSVQHFVDVVDREIDEPERQALQPVLRSVAALDVLLNNADRKAAHLLVTANGLRAIDNALSFLPFPRQRTVLLELGGETFPTSIANAIARLASDATARSALRTNLEVLLDPAEVQAFESRLDACAERPAYPRLDPWEGRPFEWW